MSDKHDRLAEAISLSFPDLTFWYGLDPEKLVRLPRWLLNVYIRELPRLQASLEAMQTQAASYPHLKKSGQNQARSSINRRLKSHRRTQSQVLKPKTKKEMRQQLQGAGIGFVDNA